MVRRPRRFLLLNKSTFVCETADVSKRQPRLLLLFIEDVDVTFLCMCFPMISFLVQKKDR